MTTVRQPHSNLSKNEFAQQLANKGLVALQSSRLLLKHGDCSGAIDRAYVSMYCMALTALECEQVNFPVSFSVKHATLSNELFSRFVSNGRLSMKLAADFDRTHADRNANDLAYAPAGFSQAQYIVDSAVMFFYAIQDLFEVLDPETLPSADPTRERDRAKA